MKAKAGYRRMKADCNTSRWLKRYFAKRTCRGLRGSRNRLEARS